MKIKKFDGFEMYPESIDGTAEWFYCQKPSGVDVDDLLGAQNTAYKGNRLYFIHSSGEIFEPVKQQENVFLGEPVFNGADRALAVIQYDFGKKVIRILKFDIESRCCSSVGEVPLAKGGDLINISVLPNSYVLVKHENIENAAYILHPNERRVELEKNEALCLMNDNKLISFKWTEAPDYREEIIFRDYETLEITDRLNGFSAIMPNGELWLMCK